MLITLQRRAFVLAALLLLGAATLIAQAQDFPNRFIRVIVGPGSDLPARFFGPKVTDVLGREVVIDPRPGAGGIIAAQTVHTSSPDGYTVLMASASYTIGTALKTMPLDLRKDFAPIALGVTVPFIVVVNKDLPFKTMGELIAYAKANPGKLNYASSGIGTPPHLAGELLKFMTKTDIVHVPFRELNSAMNALLQGSVQMTFAVAGVAKPQMDSGTMRGIAVTTESRLSIVPDLPTVAESGLPGYSVVGWNGFLAPLGTPAEAITKLNAAIQQGLDDPAVVGRVTGAGFSAAPHNTPAQFAEFIRKDTQKWIDLVENAGIKMK
jgi:tripartite-type tricarboxylate transporter receptor subunit TctC